MLQAIRGRTASWTVKLLFLFLAASFVLWGVTDYLDQAGRTVKDAVEIGGRSIDRSVLAEAINSAINRAQQIIGSIDRDQAKKLGIVDAAVDNVIQQTLIALEAQRLDIVVPDQSVVEAIMGNKLFIDSATGKFSRTLYEAFLMDRNVSEQEIEESFRRQILQRQIFGPVVGAFVPPESLISRLFSFTNEQRKASYVIFESNDMSVALPEPKPEELKSYYDSHANLLTNPEYRSFSMIDLSPVALMKQVQVTEDDVKIFYNEHKDSFATEEKRKVEQIVTNSEDDAKAAIKLIYSGENFDVVARSLGMVNGAVSLGWVTKQDLPNPLGEKAFSLDNNSVSEPVKSEFGWHLLRVTAIEAANIPSIDAVHEQVKVALLTNKATNMVVDLVNKVEDAIDVGQSIDDISTRFDLPLIKVKQVDSHGVTVAETSALDAFSAPKILQVVFSQKEGMTSHIIALGENAYALVRLDRIIPPALPPMTDILTKIRAGLEAQNRNNVAKVRAEAMLSRLEGGSSFTELANEAKIKLLTSPLITRNKNPKVDVPPALVTALFKEKEVGSYILVPNAKGYIVARLDQIVTADFSNKEDTRKKELVDNVKSAIGNDIAFAFINSLKERFPVHIDEQAINTLY